MMKPLSGANHHHHPRVQYAWVAILVVIIIIPTPRDFDCLFVAKGDASGPSKTSLQLHTPNIHLERLT